jgi:hypothetical protein
MNRNFAIPRKRASAKRDSENGLLTRFSSTRQLARKVLLVSHTIAGAQESAKIIRAETAAVAPPPTAAVGANKDWPDDVVRSFFTPYRLMRIERRNLWNLGRQWKTARLWAGD